MTAATGSAPLLSAAWQATVMQKLDAIQLENVTLRRCLYEHGVLRPISFEVELHRQRFASELHKHPLMLETDGAPPSLLVTFDLCNLAARLTANLGLGGLRDLSRAAPVLRTGMAAAAERFAQCVPPCVFVCGGLGPRGRPLDSAECLDFSTGNWAPLPNMATPRMLPATAVSTRCVFVLGGLERVDNFGLGKALRSVECLDVVKRSEWMSLPSMQNPRCAAAAVVDVASEQLYVMGGQDGQVGMSLDSVECYTINGRRGSPVWTPLPPMQRPRVNAFGVVFEDQVCVVGGRRDTESGMECITAEGFNATRGYWLPLRTLMIESETKVVMALLGSLFLVGAPSPSGFMAISSCNVSTGATQVLARMPNQLADAAWVATDRKMIVMGGKASHESMSTEVTCLDFATGTWCSMAPMVTPRVWEGAAVFQL